MEPEVKARFEYIETLLESLADRQAAGEVRISRMETHLGRMEAHLSRMEAHFQKRLDATLKIVQTGMRMLVRIEEAQRRTDRKVEELAESQKRTDRNLQLFIVSLRKSRNGRNNRPKN